MGILMTDSDWALLSLVLAPVLPGLPFERGVLALPGEQSLSRVERRQLTPALFPFDSQPSQCIHLGCEAHVGATVTQSRGAWRSRGKYGRDCDGQRLDAGHGGK